MTLFQVGGVLMIQQVFKHLVFYASTGSDLLCCPEGCCRDYTFRGRPCLGRNLRTYLLVTVAFVAGIFTTLRYLLNLGKKCDRNSVNLCICCRLLDHLLGLNLSTANF